MIIHVVQPLETLETIAQKYNVTVDKLILDNNITNPNNLVLGQTIVIVYPKELYIVQDGDSLTSISENFNVSTIQLLRNNPFLANRDSIYPGETIILSFEDEKIGLITTNGYAYPFIDKNTLRKTLPFLTYLTIFTYNVTAEGNLLDIADTEVITIAKEYGVAPIMLITASANQVLYGSDISHSILTNSEIQENLISNLLSTIKSKGYYGLNISFQYILLQDKQLFIDFLNLVTSRLNAEGFIVIVTLTPKTFKELELANEGINYFSIGNAVNNVILQSYDWGFSFGPPAAVTPFNLVQQYLDAAVIQMPPEKILLGIPSIGYNWQLPYIVNISKVNSLSNSAAIELAMTVGATIFFDEQAQAPHFHYFDASTGITISHIVWFKDARSINTLVNLVPTYALKGIGIWNIMSYFAQMWLIINTQYEIKTVY
jgi:spore germination protein